MRYTKIPSQLFKDRRSEFAKKMKRSSIAVFYSNDYMPRNGDQFYPYQQDSALFALSGIDQPGTILVLYPEAPKNVLKEIAFILPDHPDQVIWNGDRLTHKEASLISGIQTILYTDQWDIVMPAIIHAVNAIYINSREQDKFNSPVQSQNDRMAAALKTLFPLHTFHRSQPILRRMAMIKHPAEIELVKKAILITGLAFERVLHSMRPGMKEYEIEAELSYELNRHGCQHAFEPIVASGKSACTLHYIRNDRPIESNALVLIDFGAEYANMASDMTRTIPSTGIFSKEQRKIYLSVLRVLNEITNMMRPGITLDQLNKEAGKVIESELIRLKILSKSSVQKQDIKSPLWKKYFMHGISHHLGYDVHDAADRDIPLRAGMVLTCEPGIYLPELNTGIRLENDILITRKGPQNLMESIPIDPDEIETIMHL